MTSIRRAARPSAAALLGATLAVTLAACGSEEPAGSAGSTSGSDEQSGEQASGTTPESTPEATAAADWLAGELDEGLLTYQSEYGPFTDHGMSIDAAVAMARVGGHDEAVAAVAEAVEDSATDYTEFPSGKGTHVSAGSTAKALVLAQVAGTDPADFGGTDLVADLEELVGPSGRIEDSFPADNKQDADYSNVIGQVYAARALAEAGSPEADATLDHLLDQQCEDGWFRLDLAPADAKEDQGCDDAPEAQPDVDTTALAAVHLTAAAEQDEDAAEAVDEALAWLAEQQGDDGAVVAGPAEANANTTGLAGWAFGEAGRTDEAQRAADWVAGVQADEGPASGAIAFDAASLDRVAGGTVPAKARSQWLLATAQAAPALLWLPS